MLRLGSATRGSRRCIIVQTSRRQGDIATRASNRRLHFSAASSPKTNAFRQWRLPGHFDAPLVCALLGCTWKIFFPQQSVKTICESRLETTESSSVAIAVKAPDKKLWAKIKRTLRLIRRLIKLAIALTPIAALYPIQSLLYSRSDGDAQEIVLSSLEKTELPAGPLGWYFKLCFFCIEYSGAAAIKIMQWAGSRPDLFGPVFCSIFSKLQDDTTPHAWKHTERALREAYGDDWRNQIQLGEILGSGCIAQVYKGFVTNESGVEKEVAVKGKRFDIVSSLIVERKTPQSSFSLVMHPHVEDDIDADIDIMRLTVAALATLPFDIFKGIKWLNLPGFIDEMEHMLKIQLDLRTEAEHVVRFGENFKGNELVIIPKVGYVGIE
jgi:predicted unusual protein kinase regulating ubiquinone biosynthesis (AarF/ABC1/UbiB family)